MLRDREGERLKQRLLERNEDCLPLSSERDRDLERDRFLVDFNEGLRLDFDQERECDRDRDHDRDLLERGRVFLRLSDDECFPMPERDKERECDDFRDVERDRF